MDLNQVTYGNPTKEHKEFLEKNSLVDDLFLKFKDDWCQNQVKDDWGKIQNQNFKNLTPGATKKLFHLQE